MRIEHSSLVDVNAVCLSSETNVEKKSGGMAFEVILKPATESPPHQGSPPKDRPISQQDIERKLKEAEERRLVSILSSRRPLATFHSL